MCDLTNTYFEGVAAGVPKAARGRNKEKRSDCPLVTLAMVLDGSGFVRKSCIFAGNASEPATLKDMLSGMSAPPGAAVVMDAGIATEANLAWLKTHGYHYVVVIVKLFVAWPVKFKEPFCLPDSPPFDGLLSYRADADSSEPPRRVASSAWHRSNAGDSAVWLPHRRLFGCEVMTHPNQRGAAPGSRSRLRYGDVNGCTRGQSR